MRTKENLVNPVSDYYLYQPSTIASRVYLYPKEIGYFSMNQDIGAPGSSTIVFFNVYCKRSLPDSASRSAAAKRCNRTGCAY